MSHDNSLPCVYVIIVTTAGPEAYFKIGHSCAIEGRIGAVQTGCPLPIERVLHLPTPELMAAQTIEWSLHRRFRKRHTSGEWFVFDIESESDKKEFREGCDSVIRPKLGSAWAWTPYQVAEIRRLGRSQTTAVVQARRRLIRLDCDEPDNRAIRIRRGLAPAFWSR